MLPAGLQHGSSRPTTWRQPRAAVVSGPLRQQHSQPGMPAHLRHVLPPPPVAIVTGPAPSGSSSAPSRADSRVVCQVAADAAGRGGGMPVAAAAHQGRRLQQQQHHISCPSNQVQEQADNFQACDLGLCCFFILTLCPTCAWLRTPPTPPTRPGPACSWCRRRVPQQCAGTCWAWPAGGHLVRSQHLLQHVRAHTGNVITTNVFALAAASCSTHALACTTH